MHHLKEGTPYECGNCGAKASDRTRPGGFPPGWYSLGRRNTPEQQARFGRDWHRLPPFCSARCLDEYGPKLVDREQAAAAKQDAERAGIPNAG